MFEWFIIVTPIIFGFGTKAVINVIHASFQDEEHGITHALPSLLGTHLVYLAYALIIGFSYGWIVLTFPVLLTVMKYAGVALLAGLAYLIWARDKTISEENYLSFKEEFLIQAIRPAIPLIVVMIFSVFLEVDKPLGLQVITMTISLVVLSFITQVIWIAAGLVLDNEVFSEKTVTMLDRGFAALYGLFAVWVIVL